MSGILESTFHLVFGRPGGRKRRAPPTARRAPAPSPRPDAASAPQTVAPAPRPEPPPEPPRPVIEAAPPPPEASPAPPPVPTPEPPAIEATASEPETPEPPAPETPEPAPAPLQAAAEAAALEPTPADAPEPAPEPSPEAQAAPEPEPAQESAAETEPRPVAEAAAPEPAPADAPEPAPEPSPEAQAAPEPASAGSTPEPNPSLSAVTEAAAIVASAADEFLSPHFRLAEFIASDTARERGLDNMPPPDKLDHVRHAALGMEKVRELLGGHTISISSGYRSPEVNEAVGGSKTSDHMQGFSVDFSCAGMKHYEVVERLMNIPELMENVDQLIFEKSRWVHISFAPQRRGEVLTAYEKPETGKKTHYAKGLKRLDGPHLAEPAD